MSKKSQFGMTLLLSTILVGGANASTVPSSSTFGVAQVTQQGAVCKGVVKDAAGEPIIGATVKVKGSEKTGAVTDLDGVFTLSGVENCCCFLHWLCNTGSEVQRSTFGCCNL